ncbi:MAG: hypothetical protein LBF93_03535 [Zoogloeaceae bacterium]|jgi:hypothetical protein|nr:hypothetical protein [Zoogloeaceae bacterium]
MSEKTATAASYASAVASAIIGLTLNDLALLVAIVTGVATYFTSRYYQRKREARENEAARRKAELDELDKKLKELELAGIRRRKEPRPEPFVDVPETPGKFPGDAP